MSRERERKLTIALYLLSPTSMFRDLLTQLQVIFFVFRSVRALELNRIELCV